MALDKSTVARLRSNLEAYNQAKAAHKLTPLGLEVMASRLGKQFIDHGYEILRILEAHA